MTYKPPLEDIRFCLHHMVDISELQRNGSFPQLEDGTAEAALQEAGRLFEQKLLPADEDGDQEGARLENGIVRTPASFHTAYAAIRDGGWVGAIASEAAGGMGLPQTLSTPINEMMGSACLSLSLNPLLTQGTILALEAHGSEEQNAVYLPKLVSGEWSGTMNLTEPHAGSDVGALRTKAVPKGDGSWAITGEKIFISWGDCDFTSNVVHFVLARTPDAPPGTRGISLFLVPKRLPDENGDAGISNTLQPLSLERKLGLHGSPTAAMSYEEATGWLVGAECDGMTCMFTMMNAARLGVGVQGVSAAERARQLATSYAMARHQGATHEGAGPILGHADVRRMVLEMRARTEAARAICYDLAIAIDLARVEPDPKTRRVVAKRAAFLTPIAKAFGSDTGIEVANLGIQVHGGAGFIEQTGAARLLRDVRVAAIYEGTNGIQAMDLVGRKLAPDNGAMAFALVDEIEASAAALCASGSEFSAVGEATGRAGRLARETTEWMVQAQQVDREAGAVAYLRLFALARGMHHLGRGALAVPGDPLRLRVAEFFAQRILPETGALALSARAGAEGLYAVSPERIAA